MRREEKEEQLGGNKRKKIIVIIEIIIALLLIGATVGVVILMTGGKKDDFNVGYSGTQVEAEVSGQYQVGAGEVVDVGSVTFVPSEDNEGATEYQMLNFGDVKLSKSNSTVEFTFIFRNDSETVPFEVIMTDNALKDNMQATFRLVYGQIEESFDPSEGFICGAGETRKIVMKISVINTSYDAYYISSGENMLSWALVGIKTE